MNEQYECLNCHKKFIHIFDGAVICPQCGYHEAALIPPVKASDVTDIHDDEADASDSYTHVPMYAPMGVHVKKRTKSVVTITPPAVICGATETFTSPAIP